MNIKELQEKIEYDKIIRSLLEKLLATLDIRSVLDAVLIAIQEAFPFENIAYVIWSGEGSEFSNLIYIYSRGAKEKSYIASIQSDMQQFVKSLPDTVENKNSLEEQLSKKMYYEFIAGKTDEKIKGRPSQFFIVPFRSGSSILGLFHISSVSQKKLTEELINTIQKVVDTASISLENIRLLIQEEKSKVEDLLRSMTNGVVMFNSAKTIIVANPVAGKIAGLKNKNFTLTEFIDQFNKNDSKTDSAEGSCINLMEKIDEMLNTGKIIFIEEFLFNKNYFEIFITPIRNPEEKITGGSIILHDITYIIEIDKVKSEFISLASHQLRTPISVINWYTEMLLSGDAGALNKEQKDYLEQIQEGNEQMSKLVSDLLNVSRLGTGSIKIKKKATCLADMIKKIIYENESLAKKKRCRLLFNEPEIKLQKISVDPKLINQVIHNLLINAISYSAKKEKSEIDVEVEENSTDYIISIKDNGIGIPKKDQSRIFQKFFRADNAKLIEADGNGLNLYISKVIIEAHDGKIWFKSAENKGTTFYVSLPK